MSFLSKLKDRFFKKEEEEKAVYLSGFKKARQTFGDQLSEMRYEFKGVDDEFLEQLTIILLESDVGIETADLICDRLREKCTDFPGLTFHWAMNFLIEIMQEVYNEYEDTPITYNENGTTVILLEGVNGSGKTTTAAKLARMYMQQGKSASTASRAGRTAIPAPRSSTAAAMPNRTISTFSYAIRQGACRTRST